MMKNDPDFEYRDYRPLSSNEQNSPKGTSSRAAFDAPLTDADEPVYSIVEEGRAKVYPSFYAAVHRAFSEWGGVLGRCPGRESPYEPDQHDCFALAGALRVELHAAGIRLSNDGHLFFEGRGERIDMTAIADRVERDARTLRQIEQGSRRIGPDPEDREPIVVAETLEAAEVAIFGFEESARRRGLSEDAWRQRLEDAERSLYAGQDDDDDAETGQDTRTGWRALLGRLLPPWRAF